MVVAGVVGGLQAVQQPLSSGVVAVVLVLVELVMSLLLVLLELRLRRRSALRRRRRGRGPSKKHGPPPAGAWRTRAWTPPGASTAAWSAALGGAASSAASWGRAGGLRGGWGGGGCGAAGSGWAEAGRAAPHDPAAAAAARAVRRPETWGPVGPVLGLGVYCSLLLVSKVHLSWAEWHLCRQVAVVLPLRGQPIRALISCRSYLGAVAAPGSVTVCSAVFSDM